MKIRIKFKDPDGPYDAIQEAVKSQLDSTTGLNANEKENLIQERVGGILDKLKSWIEHGECITIEFDTEAKTATVIPNR